MAKTLFSYPPKLPKTVTTRVSEKSPGKNSQEEITALIKQLEQTEFGDPDNSFDKTIKLWNFQQIVLNIFVEI